MAGSVSAIRVVAVKVLLQALAVQLWQPSVALAEPLVHRHLRGVDDDGAADLQGSGHSTTVGAVGAMGAAAVVLVVVCLVVFLCAEDVKMPKGVRCDIHEVDSESQEMVKRVKTQRSSDVFEVPEHLRKAQTKSPTNDADCSGRDRSPVKRAKSPVGADAGVGSFRPSPSQQQQVSGTSSNAKQATTASTTPSKSPTAGVGTTDNPATGTNLRKLPNKRQAFKGCVAR